jgi:hypothetical protein
MNRNVRTITGFASAALVLAGTIACEVSKSRTPTSPTVAGPIAGVSITAPSPMSPANGADVLNTEPLRLVFANASSNSERKFWYVVELAADIGFQTKLYTHPRVEPASGQQTSVVVDGQLGTNATYYWRVKADDGANSSSYSSTAHFNLVVPVVIDPPTPVSPVNGQTTANNTPNLVVSNGAVQGRAGQVDYRFEIATDQAFTNIVSLAFVPRSGESTTTHASAPLPSGTQLFWRVRGTNGTVGSAYSAIQSFRTPAGPAPGPGPGPGPSPGPTPGPVGDWRSCGSTPGRAIVQCVHAAVRPPHTVAGAFEVTKRVAWLLRGGGAGLLLKPGGENITTWKGQSFSAGRIVYPNGHLFKLLSDIPTTNGPSWQDEGVDRELIPRYVPAIDPGS